MRSDTAKINISKLYFKIVARFIRRSVSRGSYAVKIRYKVTLITSIVGKDVEHICNDLVYYPEVKPL